MEQLVEGMSKACRENDCALLGGETAQLPDLYADGHFDLAGTVVGVVERGRIIDGSRVEVGDRIWALPSTGLHTNGYSLARRIIAGSDLARDVDARLGTSLGDALMAPHPSYFPMLAPQFERVKAIAHITGGGIAGNLARVLPAHVTAELEWGTWRVPPIFGVLQELGGVDPDEMLRVFNMGLGLVFVGAPNEDFVGAMEVGRIVAAGSQRVHIMQG
jgi:phosphoribosylformylglycinamidine cyclo-ligase